MLKCDALRRKGRIAAVPEDGALDQTDAPAAETGGSDICSPAMTSPLRSEGTEAAIARGGALDACRSCWPGQFVRSVECGAPKIVPRTRRQADREAVGQRMRHAGDAKALPRITVHQHTAAWLMAAMARMPNTGIRPSLGVCAIVLLALQNRLRQQRRSLLQRRDETVQLGEAHPCRRHRDTEARDQLPAW